MLLLWPANFCHPQITFFDQRSQFVVSLDCLECSNRKEWLLTYQNICFDKGILKMFQNRFPLMLFFTSHTGKNAQCDNSQYSVFVKCHLISFRGVQRHAKGLGEANQSI